MADTERKFRIGLVQMRASRDVQENLSQADALFRRRPLPRHSAEERQDVHLNAMLVHPLHAFVEIEIQREEIGRSRPSHFDLNLCVAFRSPVRMHVDRNKPN